MDGEYDVIVIGSGAGGAAAAYALAHAGLRTVVVEKGAWLLTDDSTIDPERVVHRREFVNHEPWADGAGRRLTPEEHFNVGGKTAWYGAALLRFSAAEFAADPMHGCPAWPLTLVDFEPWHTRAEQLLGVRQFPPEAGLQRILRRFATPGARWHSMPLPMALAAEITRYPREAAHFEGFASGRGFKHEAQRTLLAPLKASPNFSLIADAEVIELLGASTDVNVIAGVRLRDGRSLHARRALLGAGALHSPRLLARYLSATGLDQSLPAARHVGRNLKLHVLTAMVAMSLRPVADLLRKAVVPTDVRFTHSSVQPLGFDAELLATLLPRWLPAAVARGMGRRMRVAHCAAASTPRIPSSIPTDACMACRASAWSMAACCRAPAASIQR